MSLEKKKLSLKKETITVLNDNDLSNVNGGATTWPCVYGSVVLVSNAVTIIHDTGDKKSWWHCTSDTNYNTCGCPKP